MAVGKAKELGFEMSRRLRLDRRPRQCRGRARCGRGLDSYVFVPADLEAEILHGVYGTRLVAVQANYHDVDPCEPSCRASTHGSVVRREPARCYAKGSKTSR